MSLKTTVVLLLILGLLAGLYFWSDPPKPGITPGTGEQPLLAGISWNDVRALKVLSVNRNVEYLFKLRADGTWWMEEPMQDLASAGWIRQLREVYEGSHRTLAFRKEEIQEKVLKDTGLAVPRAFVEFRTNGRNLRVDVGEEDIRQDAIFVRVDGDIYRSRSALWSATQINVDEARERSCFKTGMPELSALTLVRRAAPGAAPETLKFEGQYNTGFKLTAPIQARCDASVIQPVLLAVLGLRVQMFQTGAVRDRKALGLDTPALEITLEGARGKEVVHIAAVPAGASAAYCWIADRDLFATVEFRDVARALDVPLAAFRSKLLFPFPAVKARRIRVDAGRGAGDALVLKQAAATGSQGGHELEAPVTGPADPVAVGTLIEALDSLVAMEFLPAGLSLADAGLEQPAITLELTFDRGARYTVRLGAPYAGAAPMVHARREDEPWVVAANAEKLPALRVHWTQLLDKRVMQVRAHEVHRVELVSGEQTLRNWRRQGTGWLRAEGAAATGGREDAEFRNLLEDRLLDLKAEAVVEGRADTVLQGLKPVATLRFLSNEVTSPVAVLDLFRKGEALWARKDGTVVVFVVKALDARNLADVLGF